jgi:hypothetical protein
MRRGILSSSADDDYLMQSVSVCARRFAPLSRQYAARPLTAERVCAALPRRFLLRQTLDDAHGDHVACVASLGSALQSIKAIWKMPRAVASFRLRRHEPAHVLHPMTPPLPITASIRPEATA